jgi:polar amino acid transport system substrate-binding protein
MRKFPQAVLALVASSALLLSACGGDDDDAGDASASGDKPTYGNCEVRGTFGDTPIETVKDGTLTVHTVLPSPGWWNGDTPDSVKDGYEYCMAANIAHRGGAEKLEVKSVSFDSLVAGQTRDFDIGLVTISITPERKKVVDFSPPYFASDLGVVVKEGGQVDGSNIASKRLGVQQGTVGQAYVTDEIKPDQPAKVFPDTATMWTAVRAGEIDAAVNDTAQALAVVKNSDGALEVAGQFKTGESYGALYPKESPNKEAFDTLISSFKEDGTLDDLAAKYLAEAFGGDPTQVPYLTLGS